MSKKLKDGIVRKDHILFDEKSHTYVNTNTQELYPSVTTILGKYKPKVVSEDLVTRTANKRIRDKYLNMDMFSRPSKIVIEKELQDLKIELKTKWDKLSELANNFGTNVHAILEDYYIGEEIDSESPYYIVFQNFQAKFGKQKFKEILTEELLYSDKYKIAGLADRIIINEDDTFSIEDYKTNKVFNTRAFQGKNGPEMLYYPFDNLENCHLNFYTIQLGVYAKLFSETTGRKLKDLNIYWYDRRAKLKLTDEKLIKEELDKYENLDGEWVKIKCDYLEPQIEYILQNYNKQK